MGIDAVHLNGAMTGIQDYTTMRQQEEGKVFLDQSNFQKQINKNVDDKLNQVQKKDDTENRKGKFDAKEKGNGSYFGDGGKQRKEEEKAKEERKASPYLGGGFDIKI